MKRLIKANSLYLYHATSKEYLDSILKNGLLINPPHRNWEEMYCDDQIFLALNTTAAKNYVTTQENKFDEIVMLKINLDSLDDNQIYYDYNNRCEHAREIDSISYQADIPASNISVCGLNDNPNQTIFDFDHTELYNIVMDTFDYEIETNKDNEDYEDHEYNEDNIKKYFGNTAEYEFTDYGVEITLPISDLLKITDVDGDFVNYIDTSKKITIQDWNLDDSAALEFDEDPNDEKISKELYYANISIIDQLNDIFIDYIYED